MSIFRSDDVFWDLTNCIPFWSYNTGLAYGVMKTGTLFIIPLIIMIIIYSQIINKLWSDKIKGRILFCVLKGLTADDANVNGKIYPRRCRLKVSRMAKKTKS